MYLTPTEEDRLRVFTAAELARRTLASGLRINAPEAVALACYAMHLAARGGASLDEVVEAGRSAVPGGMADTSGSTAGATCAATISRACSRVPSPYATSRSTRTRWMPSSAT